MPRALFTSKNLLGDGMYIQLGLGEWIAEHPDWEVDLLTLPEYIQVIYSRMGLPLRVITADAEKREPYDFEFNFDVSKCFKICDQHKCHISQGYARMLGYEGLQTRRMTFQCSDDDDHEKDLILLSMHSKSCSSQGNPPGPPNTMLMWSHWSPILSFLRQHGKIGVLGGMKDRPPLPLMEDELFLGADLDKTARMMRDARLLVTVGNGMSHLGATQGTPTILFYQQILELYYIVPTGNPKMYVRRTDPMRISVPDAVFFVRQAARQLLK